MTGKNQTPDDDSARQKMIAKRNADAIAKYFRNPDNREYGKAWQERNKSAEGKK